MSTSKTLTINSPTHFTQILNSSHIVVTDFWATWCGPCKAIAPVYEQLSSQLSRPNKITFTKVDTDAQKEIVQTYGITAMPTFVVFKAGRETRRIKGADAKQLDKVVKELAVEAGRADEGGSGDGGVGSAGWTAFAAPRGYPDVTENVDVRGLDFLNVDSETGEKKVIFEGSKPSALGSKPAADSSSSSTTAKHDWIESDTDEQLMLFIPFQMTLKLHSIHLTSLPSEDTTRPKTIHIYTNTSTVLDFDEADSVPATQTFSLTAAAWDTATGTAKLDLRFVKFQNISSLVVFVADGEVEGREKTRIDRVRMFGETGVKRDQGKLEKVGDDH